MILQSCRKSMAISLQHHFLNASIKCVISAIFLFNCFQRRRTCTHLIGKISLTAEFIIMHLSESVKSLAHLIRKVVPMKT